MSYAYDPYGNIRSAPGADAPVAWYNPITYAGGIKDHQTGLTRFGVRWYDPNTARFTTPDPTAQEANAYLYAGGNPCNLTDVTGGACSRRDKFVKGANVVGSGIALVASGAEAAMSGGLAIPVAVGAGIMYASAAVDFEQCL